MATPNIKLIIVDSKTVANNTFETDIADIVNNSQPINIEGTSEKLKHLVRSHKIVALSSLKTLWVNCFVNRNIEWPQKIKTILFMKLTVATMDSLLWEI